MIRPSPLFPLAVVMAFPAAAWTQPPPEEPVPPTPAEPAAPTPPPAPEPPPPAPDPSWAPPLPMVEQPPPSDDGIAEGQVAPPVEDEGVKMELYGHAMLDLGFDFGKIGDPNWQDVMRPTKLPAFDDQYGKGPRTFMGVRQSRFGVNATVPTDRGDIFTKFEFEMFGVGTDEGQTTFRLRHFYGTWHRLTAGQTWSLFMDIDVFPNSIEYWGPNGMVFFRNVQASYRILDRGPSRIAVGVERPGASADTGDYQERVVLEDVVARFPAPDVTAEARYGGDWGYVELAGILRWIKWDDLSPTPLIQGEALGWGVNLSSNLNAGPLVFKLQGVYGEAIGNYMNDATVDIVPQQTADPNVPEGVALPALGVLGFVDVKWSDCFTSSAGYSFVWLDNADGQRPDAFHMGHYALGNLLYYPTKNLMFGPELQFGRRSNFDDGFDVNDYKLQFSIKYSFSKTFGGP